MIDKIKSIYYNKTILSSMIEWFNTIAAIYLIITFFFRFHYQQPALYVYFITLIIDIIINKRYNNVKWFKAKWCFITMILFYLCIWVWHIFEETTIQQFTFASENRLPFLIFGILGLFFNINPKLKPEYFAIPMLMVPIIYSIYTITMYMPTIFTMSFAEYQHNFAYYRDNLLLSSHMDFNLYMNLAIMFGLYALYKFKNKKIKFLIILCITLVFGLLLTSDGRIGFITACILLFGSIGFYIVRINKKLILPIIALSIICTTFIISNHQRIKQIDSSKIPRIAIWEHAIKIIKEKPILGYGVSDGRIKFVDDTNTNENFYNHYLKYFNQKHPELKNEYQVHPHNVFLESMIEFGIIGLFLICSIMIIPMLFTSKKKQLFITILIFIFGMQSLFEVLRAYLPPIYLCWFLYIFLLIPTENEETIQLSSKELKK